uniref:Protein kinase domain-containing protein n=1 Tax=Panagrolaimus superbus TaxID=310955 RepID=A0A914XQB9_9BILA
MQTAVRINKRMFNAIRNLHTIGFIHRNIQPSNFAIGSQKAQAAIVFIIGFSLAARYEQDLNGFEIDITTIKPQHAPRRINTLNSIYMSRRSHSTMQNLTRLDDIESWLFSCLDICILDCLPWKKSFIASEALEMKKNFFLHQYTFELFFERIPIDYRRIIDVLNSSLPKSTPDYSKISEINDKICKLYPTMHKKKPSSASPVLDTTKSLMLPTICLPAPSNQTEEKDTHSFYGIPKDVFPVKGKSKEMKSKNVKKSPASAPAILPASKDAKKKSSSNNNNAAAVVKKIN